MKQIIIEFDDIPPEGIRPNKRGVGHLTEKRSGEIIWVDPNKEEYDSWKSYGHYLGLEQLNAKGATPIDGPCVLSIQFRNPRRIDAQGFGFSYKGFVDGLQEAGLITNDGVIFREVVERLPNGPPYTKIVLTQREALD